MQPQALSLPIIADSFSIPEKDFNLGQFFPFLSPQQSPNAHSPTKPSVFEIDSESPLQIPLWQEENKKPFYESLTEYCYGNKHNSELLKHFLMGSIYTDS